MFALAGEAAQDRIDQRGDALVAKPFGQFDRSVDGGSIGHPVEPAELVGAQAQDVSSPGRKLGHRARAERIEHPVEALLPAYRAQDQLGTDPTKPFPRDIALVKWQVNEKGLNDETTIADAPLDSDLRNVFDPNLAE